MTLTQSDLEKFPMFLTYLISVCQGSVCHDEKVVEINLLKKEDDGFHIRYRVCSWTPLDRKVGILNWIVVNKRYSSVRYQFIEKEIKGIFRDKQLSELGI